MHIAPYNYRLAADPVDAAEGNGQPGPPQGLFRIAIGTHRCPPGKPTAWKALSSWPTENLKKLDKSDPVKFDFALFGLGPEGFGKE